MPQPDSLRARALSLAGELYRYGLCSALALVCDVGLLLTLHHGFGVNHLAAAAIGFSAGIVVVYVTSVRYAFRDRRFAAVRTEIAWFLATGIAGLLLTQIALKLLVDDLGLPVVVAKGVTVALVFTFNFSARRLVLFTPRKAR